MAAAESSLGKSAELQARKELAEKVYAALAKAIPEPKAELHYGSVYELLTSVMLSAQATDKSVNAVTPELFRLAPTPAKMLELGEDGVRDIVKTVGLANTKARHIIGAAEILVSEFGGSVPETIEELTRLPGVGEKTAKVVLNVGFGKGVIAVDTHILRVANRLGLSAAKTPAGVSKDLEEITSMGDTPARPRGRSAGAVSCGTSARLRRARRKSPVPGAGAALRQGSGPRLKLRAGQRQRPGLSLHQA